jgi:hypothetical protein
MFGSELGLEIVCNTGFYTSGFEEALHTYNRVADVQKARLQGLDTVRFLDNTDLNKAETQMGDVAIASQTDNAYLNTQSIVDLLDTKMGRWIRLWKATRSLPWFGIRGTIKHPRCGTLVIANGCSFSGSRRATSWALRSVWHRGRNTK